MRHQPRQFIIVTVGGKRINGIKDGKLQTGRCYTNVCYLHPLGISQFGEQAVFKPIIIQAAAAGHGAVAIAGYQQHDFVVCELLKEKWEYFLITHLLLQDLLMVK